MFDIDNIINDEIANAILTNVTKKLNLLNSYDVYQALNKIESEFEAVRNRLKTVVDNITEELDNKPMTKKERIEAEENLKIKVKQIKNDIGNAKAKIINKLFYMMRDELINSELNSIPKKYSNEIGKEIWNRIYDHHDQIDTIFEKFKKAAEIAVIAFNIKK